MIELGLGPKDTPCTQSIQSMCVNRW